MCNDCRGEATRSPLVYTCLIPEGERIRSTLLEDLWVNVGASVVSPAGLVLCSTPYNELWPTDVPSTGGPIHSGEHLLLGQIRAAAPVDTGLHRWAFILRARIKVCWPGTHV